MQSPSNYAGSIFSANVPARDRDRDLLEADEVLDDEFLDNLWNRFDKALDDHVDRQLVFVKMVNSVNYLAL